MSTISSTSASNSNPISGGAASATTATDMQDRFLKLLITQMKNQDPMNPLENAEVTSQMAQMSTVSGIEKLNSVMSSLSSSLMSTQVGQAAGLIGKTVTAESSQLEVSGGNAVVGFDLPTGATSVTLDIVDNKTGSVVKTIEEANVDTSGKTYSLYGMEDGNYSLSLKAFNESGLIEGGHTLVRSTIKYLTPNASGFGIGMSNGDTVSMSNIRVVEA